mmetsp:Transcript_29520/g.70298  ORF Transcript_29520/g.70298 Transcript_29520/m.70298 type:complete len:237 (-) Transcript_29520:1321-2031(-)
MPKPDSQALLQNRTVPPAVLLHPGAPRVGPRDIPQEVSAPGHRLGVPAALVLGAPHHWDQRGCGREARAHGRRDVCHWRPRGHARRPGGRRRRLAAQQGGGRRRHVEGPRLHRGVVDRRLGEPARHEGGLRGARRRFCSGGGGRRVCVQPVDGGAAARGRELGGHRRVAASRRLGHRGARAADGGQRPRGGAGRRLPVAPSLLSRRSRHTTRDGMATIFLASVSPLLNRPPGPSSC